MLEPSPYAAIRQSRTEPQRTDPAIGIRQLLQQMRGQPTQVAPAPVPPEPQPVRSVLKRRDAPLDIQ